MVNEYMHGITIDERSDIGPPNITEISTSVIGLVATAEAGEDDKLYLVSSLEQAAAIFAKPSVDKTKPADISNNVMMRALKAIFYQVETKVICVKQARDASGFVSWSEENSTGIYALLKAQAILGETPKIIVAPNPPSLAYAMAEDNLKVANTAKAAADTKYTELDAAYQATAKPYNDAKAAWDKVASGTPAAGTPEAKDKDDKSNEFKAKEKYYNDAKSASDTASQAKTTAQLNVDTASTTLTNAQKADGADISGRNADILKVCAKLRAVGIIETAYTKKSFKDALEQIKGLTSLSSRLYPVATWVRGVKDIGVLPGSVFAAGLFALVDKTKGFWVSPSNNLLNAIDEIINPISFSVIDSTSQTNQLNELGCAVIAKESGFRLWGARSLATRSSDENELAQKFISVRRLTDTLNESVARSSLWAVDRGVTKNFLAEVCESVNAYMRILKSEGAVIDGKCYVDPAQNPSSQIKEGRVIFSMDYTPSYPAEQIRIQSSITTRYLQQIFA